MATEKRLIDAYKEVQKLYSLPESRYVLETNPAARKIIDWFFHAPTVDAVEVVRCKDCKHYSQNPWADEEELLCKCWGGWLPTSPDDFCSCGERRTDE